MGDDRIDLDDDSIDLKDDSIDLKDDIIDMGDDSIGMQYDSIDMGDDSIDVEDDSIDMGYLVTLPGHPAPPYHAIRPRLVVDPPLAAAAMESHLSHARKGRNNMRVIHVTFILQSLTDYEGTWISFRI